MDDKIIRVVAALIRDSTGLVRKRGTSTFMQPSAKLNPGKSDVAALSREIIE
jgi:hypothetical protein